MDGFPNGALMLRRRRLFLYLELVALDRPSRFHPNNSTEYFLLNDSNIFLTLVSDIIELDLNIATLVN